MLNRALSVKNLIVLGFLQILAYGCALDLNNESGYSSNVLQLSSTGSSQFEGGDTYTIEWEVAELEGLDPTLTIINLYYSTDAGANWTIIEEGLEDTGSYAWILPNLEAADVRVAVEMINGDVTRFEESESFSVDSLPPEFAAGSFKINGGASSTGNFNVTVELSATDGATNITHFCLKYSDTSQPTSNASCWIAVNAPSPGLSLSRTLNLSGFYTTIGLIAGPYTIYAWTKDEHGRISDLSASGAGTEGQDKATILFSPSTPPTVTDVLAVSRDDPSDPPSTADKTATLGSDLFIKWNVSDAEGLSANPISLSYTTDDVNWTSITTGLSNGQNGACTVDHPGTTADDTATGCYYWSSGSPTSAYYKVRVVALDDAAIESAASSLPINADKVNIIAGNVDHGLGYSASSAMFFSETNNASYPDKDSFVITQTGMTIFKDRDRGILYVDPADGLLKTLIEYNSSNPSNQGDGGPISSATIRDAIAIQLDFSDRLLIWDDTRIRRVTLNYSNIAASTIETIIGGGSDTNDTIASALDLKITAPSLSQRAYAVFEALPKGKIYFTSSGYNTSFPNYRLRVYDPLGANQIVSYNPGGTGASTNPTLDLSLCQIRNLGFAFDPVTSAILDVVYLAGYDVGNGCLTLGEFRYVRADPSTYQSVGGAGTHPSSIFNYTAALSYHRNGRDGNLYTVGPNHGRIWKLNLSSGDFDVVVGNAVVGECADGTAALSCPIQPLDVWVTATGTIYFLDRGQIRYVDGSGNVQTIMGQGWSYGDGGSALFARFKELADLAIRNSGEVIVLDADARQFREFTPGSTISTIAGTGEDNVADTVNLAINEPLNLEQAGSVWDNFTIDPTNGDIFFHRATRTMARLDRATGKWVDLILRTEQHTIPQPTA